MLEEIIKTILFGKTYKRIKTIYAIYFLVASIWITNFILNKMNYFFHGFAFEINKLIEMALSPMAIIVLGTFMVVCVVMNLYSVITVPIGFYLLYIMMWIARLILLILRIIYSLFLIVFGVLNKVLILLKIKHRVNHDTQNDDIQEMQKEDPQETIANWIFVQLFTHRQAIYLLKEEKNTKVIIDTLQKIFVMFSSMFFIFLFYDLRFMAPHVFRLLFYISLVLWCLIITTHYFIINLDSICKEFKKREQELAYLHHLLDTSNQQDPPE